MNISSAATIAAVSCSDGAGAMLACPAWLVGVIDLIVPYVGGRVNGSRCGF